MFFGGMKCDSEKSVEITDIEPQVFKQMIQYIYVGQSSISSYKNACDLYLAAKKYILLHLERHCVNYITEHIDFENIIQIFEFAQFHCEDELETLAKKEIQRHTSRILKEEPFLQASESTLATLLDLDRLNISSECELFTALERWAQAQVIREGYSEHDPRAAAKALIKKLRLLTITKQEFVASVAPSTLLSDSEKLSLLLRIVSADFPPMLNGLCEKRSKRKPCREHMRTTLEFEEVSEARCDGSEWFTTIFTINTRIMLLGIEINLQNNEEEGLYKEDVMVKLGLAHREDHFAEGNLQTSVPYNSKAQIMFSSPSILEPNARYAIHVFLCSSGIYPLGYQTAMSCRNTNVDVDFASHTSWEQCHPWNTTVLSSLLFSDVIES